jgi:hypothetical protein
VVIAEEGTSATSVYIIVVVVVLYCCTVVVMISWMWFIPAVVSFRTDDFAEGLIFSIIHLLLFKIKKSYTQLCIGYTATQVLEADDEWISADKWIYRLLFSSAQFLLFCLLFYSSWPSAVAETLNSDVLYMRRLLSLLYQTSKSPVKIHRKAKTVRSIIKLRINQFSWRLFFH